MRTLKMQKSGSLGWVRVAAWFLAFSLLNGVSLFASIEPAPGASKTQNYKKAHAVEVKKADEPVKLASTSSVVKKSRKTAKIQKGDLNPAPPSTAPADAKKDAVAAKPAEPKKADEPKKIETPPAAVEKPADKVEDKPAEESSEKNNWLKLSGTQAFVSGDKSAFRARAQVPTDLSGGVESFHAEDTIAEDTMMKIDGRGLFDNHDYLLTLDVRRDNVGYVNTGYREFRTWYDNTGGFFPKNDQWFDLYGDQEFAIDRADIWFETGLTLPDLPEFIFRYERLSRDGRKDSTSWGDTTLTGGLGLRNIVPTFWQIDEKRDIFSLDMKDKVDDTAYGLGARYELTSQDNGLYSHRRPDQTTTDRYVTQREVVNLDNFNVHGFQETDFGEGTMFTTSYAFTTLDSETGGSRIYGQGFNAPFGAFPQAQANDSGFVNLAGGSRVNQHAATLNYITVPWDDVSLILALRIDDTKTEGVSTFQATNFAGPTQVRNTLLDDQERLTVAEKMELRYNGVPDWVFYLRGDFEQGKGDWTGNQATSDTAVQTIFWDTNIERTAEKYTIGSNWYPMKEVNTSAQYYVRFRETDYNFPYDSTINSPVSTNRYPMYITAQQQLTHDVAFRVSSHPCSILSMVSRYDFTLNERRNGVDSLETVESADTRTHILSQSITLTPISRLYLQANLSWTMSETDTPADERTGAAIDQVWDSQNSYVYANFVTGFALTEATDLTAGYSFYRAYDYLDQSSTSLGYGAGNEEHAVTAGVLWRMAENIKWSLKYSFIKSIDQTSGDQNNFTAHLAYTGIEVAF